MIAELLSNLIEKVQDHGFETVFKRYYSSYRAKVVDNADPENRGRVKVVVPNLFGEKEIPDFAVPKDFRNFGPNRGEFYPPEVGDWVFVEFEGGDPDFPIYSGGWASSGEVSPEFAHVDNKPQVRGYRTKKGFGFSFDETEGKEKMIISTPGGQFIILDDTVDSEGAFFIHKTGAQLQIDNQGSVKILGQDGSFFFIDSENSAVTMTAKSGSFITISEDGVTLSDSSGGTSASISNKTLQLVTDGNFKLNGNTVAVNSGSFQAQDPLKASVLVGGGKVALGTPQAEIVDLLDQVITAFLQAPTLVTTGTGPSSPLTPPVSLELTKVKLLLNSIKGKIS